MDKSIVPDNQIATRSSTCYEFSNSNPAEVVELDDEEHSVETVEKQIENLKLNYQFNEKDVPQIFKTLINARMSDLEEVNLQCDGSTVFLVLDDLFVRFKKETTDNWTVTYRNIFVDTTIETLDPEKSAIDHLWFVLKNPRIKPKMLGIMDTRDLNPEKHHAIDSEKLNTLLQSMLNSIEHQLFANSFDWQGCDEDTFLSMLKHLKPEPLDKVWFLMSRKEEGHYQKLKEIVEMDQWKQAKYINSVGFTPLKIDDFLHCEHFWLELASITPEDVQRVVEHTVNSSCTKSCKLSCEDKKYDIKAIIDFIQSQNDESTFTEVKIDDPELKFSYIYEKSGKAVLLVDIDTDSSNEDNDWMICYEENKTDDPEKSILDHLWLVLKNPNIELFDLNIGTPELIYYNTIRYCENINLEKLETVDAQHTLKFNSPH